MKVCKAQAYCLTLAADNNGKCIWPV